MARELEIAKVAPRGPSTRETATRLHVSKWTRTSRIREACHRASLHPTGSRPGPSDRPGSLLEDPVFQPGPGGGLSQGMKAGAVVGTIMAPFASLAVALVMLGSEQNPIRRSFLKTWAAISGGILLVWLLIVISIFSAVSTPPPRETTGVRASAAR